MYTLKTKSCVSLTFSVSVQTWMALGMSRAVFSFVIEQMSFSRTVSFKQTHKCTPLLTHTHPILPERMHRSAAIPAFPSGRCCYRNRSSSQRGRVVPAGGCPAEEHRSSLQHGWVMKSDMMENEKKDGTGTAPCSTETTTTNRTQNWPFQQVRVKFTCSLI